MSRITQPQLYGVPCVRESTIDDDVPIYFVQY